MSGAARCNAPGCTAVGAGAISLPYYCHDHHPGRMVYEERRTIDFTLLAWAILTGMAVVAGLTLGYLLGKA